MADKEQIKNKIQPKKKIQSEKKIIPKYKNFCFTLYNINEDESEVLKEFYEKDFCKLLFYTHELGSKEQVNPHIQGFLSMQNSYTLNAIKKKINNIFKTNFNKEPNPHIEIAKGNAYQNYLYITKELELNPNLKHQLYGNKPMHPGKTSDSNKFESYVKLLEEGKIDLKKIEKEDLAHYVKHEKYYSLVYTSLIKRGIKPPIFVAWFSGSTGTGKSFTAREIAKILNFDIYDADCHNNFFNIYQGEEMSIWDDYRSGPITFSTLLKMTDRNGFMMNIKGGKVFFIPKIQIFTSPDGIESAKTEAMKSALTLDNKFDQLKRRISYVVNFKSSNEKSLAFFEEVKRNSEEVIKHFLGSYRQFLIDTGYGEFIDLIPNLNKYEPIQIKKLIDFDKNTKLSFSNEFKKELKAIPLNIELKDSEDEENEDSE